MSAALSCFIDQVKMFSSKRQACRIVGGQSKNFYGNTFNAELPLLSLKEYTGVMDYEPSELVLVAKAGTSLLELEAILQKENQMLAFEPPSYTEQATIGGAVASAIAGPRRSYAGAVRDFVLGTQLLDGQGQVLNFGGKVMKNVAGYDVSRLLTGSLGTLGVLLEISLKVLPIPECEETLCVVCTQQDALNYFDQWRSQSLPLSATAWVRDADTTPKGCLYLRLSGSEVAVREARRSLGFEQVPDDPARLLWRQLTNHQHSLFMAPYLWRVSLPAATPVISDDMTVLEWGGCQRWTSLSPSDELVQRIRDLGGHVSVFKQPFALPVSKDVFQLPGKALQVVHRQLKQQFDPASIFNPGRLYSFM